MGVFATPVRSGDFVYSGELLVDPGNSRQYRKADEGQLRALLQPDSKETIKDETAPFYEAQLVHYGLQRTKDKARAKWRLLDALNAGSLQVPQAVKQTEAALKKEHSANIKRAKQQSKTANDASQPAAATAAQGSEPPKKKQKVSTTASAKTDAAASSSKQAPAKSSSKKKPATVETGSKKSGPPSVSSHPKTFTQPTSPGGPGPGPVHPSLVGTGRIQTARCS